MQTSKTLFSLITLLALSNVACSTTPLYATVPENAAIGRNVTSVLTTSQMGEDDVQCEIVEGDEHGRFMITTCRITVARPLDYDVSPMYNLRVNVTRPVGKVEERRVDIQVQEVEGYPPVYNDTCAMPVLVGGKSGSPIFDVTDNTIEIMEKTAGILSITSRIPDSLRKSLGSLYYHASSDCRVQFSTTIRDETGRDMAAANVMRGKCLQCFSSPDDVAVFELAVPNTDGSAECDFASDVGSNFDDLNTRLDIVGSFRMFKAPEASELYNFKCNLPKLTLPLPVRSYYQQYEVTHLSRLGFDAKAIGCPPNKYGVMCDKYCGCENGARCHAFNGACKCQPGWQGVVCDIPHSTVAIIATPSDSRQIHIKSSLTLECRAFNLAVERMMWGFPNGTKTWLQRTQEDPIIIESIRSEHNGTYTCTVVTEDKRVFLASYELQAVICPPRKMGELCESDCNCPEEASCDRWAGCVCLPGYIGTMCKTWCPQGTFGQNCSSECQCQNAVRCDHQNGHCFCYEGWYGVDCSMPCPSGRYGEKCKYACSCKNNATCHHVDGNCTCELPWTGQWCEVMQTDIQIDIQTDSFLLPLQISVPLILVLLVLAALVVLYMRKRATRVKQNEGLEEVQALLELTSMEENLTQSLKPGWLNRWERKTKDLTLGQLIGLGTFAHIRKGHLRIDNADVTVAVKSVRTEDRQCYQAFCREVSALIAVHEHQEHNNGASNIVRLFGVITKSTPKCVLLEYASGDLLQLLKLLKQQTERRRLDHVVLLLSDVLRYAVHISRALEELRRLPIAHGDVAARNVLISADDVAKLTDFGLARDVYSTISSAASVRTDAEDLLPLKWMALESLKCRHFTCESDTWSFGVLLWEIAAFGEEPNYQEMVRLTYPNLVEFLRMGMRLLKPRGCPNRLYDVMRSCWRQEPSARPTPEELEQKLTECRHEIDLQFMEKETTV